jgi:hypothetical protein
MNRYYVAALLVLAKKARIEVVLISDGVDRFVRKYTRIKGRAPNMRMVSRLHPDADKWGNQLRIICKRISENEIEVLRRGLHIGHIYPNPAGGYRFGNNQLVWTLLRLGFDVAGNQDYEEIIDGILRQID